MNVYRTIFKRLFDLILSLTGFVILLPVFIFVTVLLWINNAGTAFFVQPRPGRNCVVINLVKFKTMTDKTDEDGNLLPDADRLTALGKFIRKTSLDEIPQLLNVIRGDMSLVGPRPLLMEYLTLYSEEQRRRHEVRPGITGWAQIHGRNAISWKQKFEYDVWYVDHLSFWLDVRILLMTILKVFKAEGISAQGMATTERFDGEN